MNGLNPGMPQDPLAQLRDIHLPEAIGYWPLAPGWWIFIGLSLLIFIGLAYAGKRYHKQTAFKRAATDQLAAIEAHTECDQTYLQAINRLLKQTALATHDRKDIAGLKGQDWLTFLDKHSDSNFFTTGEGKVLSQGPYQSEPPSFDKATIQKEIKHWIKRQQRAC